MIYFIVTTSLFDNSTIRQEQYTNGINKLKQLISNKTIQNYKIIIVENNGSRETFLNLFECEVYYTNNNFSNKEKGYKELQDVLDCIEYYNIRDDDFIVKITGRYILDDNSEFMDEIANLENKNYDCVIKYGSFGRPLDYKVNDCITGLIGMRCIYVKQIEKPKEDECVEWKWAGVTNLIDNRSIHMVKNLGINICPGSNSYFYI